MKLLVLNSSDNPLKELLLLKKILGQNLIATPISCLDQSLFHKTQKQVVFIMT